MGTNTISRELTIWEIILWASKKWKKGEVKGFWLFLQNPVSLSARAENHTLYNAILAPHTYWHCCRACVAFFVFLYSASLVSCSLSVCSCSCLMCDVLLVPFLVACPCVRWCVLHPDVHREVKKIENRGKINTYSIHIALCVRVMCWYVVRCVIRFCF